MENAKTVQQKPVVPVVFATDDKFAKYCAIAIKTLILHSSPDRKYDIYIFHEALEKDNQDRLCSMQDDHVSIQCVDVGKYVDREKLYIHSRQSLATYFRFYAPDVLAQYDKILYLDSDIAVLGDVGEMFDIDIGDNLLGGVVIFRKHAHEVKDKKKYLEEVLGIPAEEYINAGILIMNLKGFRDEKIKEKCMQYLTEHPKPRWMDQDVLNSVCRGRIFKLEEKWNTSQFYFGDDLRAGKDISDVRIVHYLDRRKPGWSNFRPAHVYAYIYARETPYAEELVQAFLDGHVEDDTDYRREFNLMAERCDIGPRYFVRGTWLWCKGKIKKLLKLEKKA